MSTIPFEPTPKNGFAVFATAQQAGDAVEECKQLDTSGAMRFIPRELVDTKGWVITINLLVHGQQVGSDEMIYIGLL